MRLREFFYNAENDEKETRDDNQERFVEKKKSFFTPKSGRDQWLDTYLELVRNDIINSLRKAGKLNVTREEKTAFYSLLENKDIIIRPADKDKGRDLR